MLSAIILTPAKMSVGKWTMKISLLDRNECNFKITHLCEPDSVLIVIELSNICFDTRING